jgi:hypothetical protein
MARCAEKKLRGLIWLKPPRKALLTKILGSNCRFNQIARSLAAITNRYEKIAKRKTALPLQLFL